MNIKICGRPVGYVVSDKTKEKIRKTRKGCKHTQETRDKISAGLSKYYNKLNPLSDEMMKQYKKYGDSVLKFIEDNKEELNNIDDVLTDRKLKRVVYNECAFEDWMFPDNRTPEFLLILAEEIKDKYEEE